MIVQISWTS